MAGRQATLRFIASDSCGKGCMDRADELSANAPSIDVSDSANVAAAVAACGIAFMAKASAPGRAKTRLVSPLTFEEAAALNTAFLQDVAANVMLAARQAAPHARIAG